VARPQHRVEGTRRVHALNRIAHFSAPAQQRIACRLVTVPLLPVAARALFTEFSLLETDAFKFCCTIRAQTRSARRRSSCRDLEAVAAGGKATSVVTVKTTAASGGNALNQWGRGGILALALLFVTPTLRRRKTTLLLIAGGIAIIGCGGGGSASSAPPPTTTPATTPGTYVFLVTATDASNAKMTASANLTITVK